MREKNHPFNKAGINRLDYVLKISHPELHPMYLSSLIDFLGKSMCQLPTQKNENELLLRIREISGLNISKETFIRTQRILTLTRKKRLLKTGLFIIRGQKKKFFFEGKGRYNQ